MNTEPPPGVVWNFTPSRLVVPVVDRLPQGIRLREYEPRDKGACIALYAKSQLAGFPHALDKEFDKALDANDYLKLVLCIEDKPVAIGGIGRAVATHGNQSAWLVMDVVHPDHIRQGLGTALVLARLAALSEPSEPAHVMLSPVPGVAEFYARFGLKHQGQLPAQDMTRPPFEIYMAQLDSDAWRKCREAVRTLGFALDQFPEVPLIEYWRQVRERRLAKLQAANDSDSFRSEQPQAQTASSRFLRPFYVCAALLLIAASVVFAVQILRSAPAQLYRVKTIALNCRKSGNPDSPVLAELMQGTQVSVMERINGWARIHRDGVGDCWARDSMLVPESTPDSRSP